MAITRRRRSWWPMMDPAWGWRQFDRLWDDLVGLRRRRSEVEPTAWAPSAEIHHGDDELAVSFEIPGVQKKAIDIECTEDGLTVKGERKAPEGTCPTDGVCCTEFCYGPFERTVPWPLAVKAEESKASYQDGILEVRVPIAEKAKARKPKRVEIA